jgi:hypothetical protein
MPCQSFLFLENNRSGRSGLVFTQIHHFSGLFHHNKHPGYTNALFCVTWPLCLGKHSAGNM